MPERRRKFLKLEALEAVRSAAKQENDEMRRAKLEEGISKYREYLGFPENEDDDDAWAGLGGAYRRIDDIDAAIESYATAYRLNGESTYALVNLVSLMAARRRPEDEPLLQEYAAVAGARLRKKIDDEKVAKERGGPPDRPMNPVDYWTWYDMATLELIQGKTSQSMSSFLYAVERTPKAARENFLSVLSNLEFLAKHQGEMPGLAGAISLIKPYAESPAVGTQQG